MSDLRISQLTANAAPAATDAFPTAQAGTTRKTTIAQIFALAAATAINWTAVQSHEAATAATQVAGAKVTADVADRWVLGADGKQTWGDGTGAGDTNLYRSAANTLKTDDAFQAASMVLGAPLPVASGGTGAATLDGAGIVTKTGAQVIAGAKTLSDTITSNLSGTGGVGYAVTVAAEANARYAVLGDGKVEWGAGGAAARDANLYRSGAAELKTDGAFVVGTTAYVATSMRVGSTSAPSSTLSVTGTFGVSGGASLGATLAVASTVDAGGTIRAYGSTAPASGAGVECHYTGANGYVQSYDRTGAAYMPLNLRGSTVNLAPSGTTVLAASTGAAAVTGTFGVTGLSTLTGGLVSIAAPSINTARAIGTQYTITSTSGTYAGVESVTRFNPTANAGNAVYAAYFSAETTAGNVRDISSNGLRGLISTCAHAGTGALTGAIAIQAGSITNTGGGSIANAYGVYISAQTAATNNWGLYDLSSQSYHAGNVGFGTSSPACKVDAAGTIRATSAATPASGSGVEALYTGGIGYVGAFNRSGSVRLPMAVQGLTVTLNTTGGDALVADSTTTVIKAAGTTVATATTSELVLAKPARLMSYTLAGLPAATSNGGVVYCTDHTGGARPVYSDGTNWRDFRTGNVAA